MLVPILLLVFIHAAYSMRFVDRKAERMYHGVQLPLIGVGTAGLPGDQTRNTIVAAIRAGITMIDTAQAAEWYNESGVMDALLELSQDETVEVEDLVIVTKVHPRSYSFNAMDHKLRESRRMLQPVGTKRQENALDVVLLHTPWCWEGMCTKEQLQISWQTAWNNLEKIRLDPEHSISAIGVSNFHIEILKELVLHVANEKVAVVQNWMDPFHQDIEVRKFAKEHNIQYMAYSSFGTQWNRLVNPVLTNEVLKNIAAKHGCSVAQVVTSWVIQEGAIAIPRSSRMDHIQDNFGHLSVFQPEHTEDSKDVVKRYSPVQLSESDMQRIRELDGTLGNPWN